MTFDALPRHDVALVIGGRAWTGWTGVSIDRGIDSLCGSFRLEMTAREKTGLPPVTFQPGDAAQVVLGGKPLITGYADAREWGIEAEAVRLAISGRDKAADLIDCSALNKPGSWRGAKLEAIASELAAPFGVPISFRADTGKPLARFALQQGETAWAAIERLARYRGLILFSDGLGGVVVGNPDSGLRAGRIAEGDNALSIDERRDDSQRFSQYVIKGQASGSDERNGAAVAQVKGEARDAGVARYRPMLVIGEEQSDQDSLKKRAEWEAVTRAARAQTVTAQLPGWFAVAGGAVWEPGARAELVSETLGLSGDRLIERVSLTRDSEGTRTTLTLVPPEAWTQLAEKEADQ